MYFSINLKRRAANMPRGLGQGELGGALPNTERYCSRSCAHYPPADGMHAPGTWYGPQAFLSDGLNATNALEEAACRLQARQLACVAQLQHSVQHLCRQQIQQPCQTWLCLNPCSVG